MADYPGTSGNAVALEGAVGGGGGGGCIGISEATITDAIASAITAIVALRVLRLSTQKRLLHFSQR